MQGGFLYLYAFSMYTSGILYISTIEGSNIFQNSSITVDLISVLTFIWKFLLPLPSFQNYKRMHQNQLSEPQEQIKFSERRCINDKILLWLALTHQFLSENQKKKWQVSIDMLCVNSFEVLCVWLTYLIAKNL